MLHSTKIYDFKHHDLKIYCFKQFETPKPNVIVLGCTVK